MESGKTTFRRPDRLVPNPKSRQREQVHEVAQSAQSAAVLVLVY
jgi:hypothetical protein